MYSLPVCPVYSFLPFLERHYNCIHSHIAQAGTNANMGGLSTTATSTTDSPVQQDEWYPHMDGAGAGANAALAHLAGGTCICVVV